MANLLDAKSIIGVCRIRITPRNNECEFVAGTNAYVFDAPLELSWTVNREDGVEINNKRLSNVACAPIRLPGYDKSIEITGKFCDFCSIAFADFFSWNAYLNAGATDTVAIGRPLGTGAAADLCSTTGFKKFSMEVFTPVKQTSGICSDTTTQNIRVTLPLIIDPYVGDVTFANDDTTNFTFTATGLGDNGTYLNGPFNDFSGVNVIAGDGEIWEALPDNFVLPTASCTPVPVPVQ